MKKITLLVTLLFFYTISWSQDFDIEVFAQNFSQPTNITNAGDDRLFVTEKGGLIKIVQSDGSVNPTPFLDISSLISTNSERGLLGLAFHPDYASNGYFYVYYSDTSGDSQISRFSVSSADPDIADLASELPILFFTQPFSNHNGGCLQFGLDGYLYIASGDGGSGGDPGDRAQNTELLLGKLLRIDIDNPVTGGPNYGIPADNPFAGDPSKAQEIWAYGLRNPWKFSFDQTAGDIWIADVGQTEYEEINKASVMDAGLNYGWRCYEASAPYNTTDCPDPSQLVFPVAEYPHPPSSASITGGYVYRGTLYPELEGYYFYADFLTNVIGTVDSNNDVIENTFVGTWSTFGEDNNKELYIASYNGTVYKIIGTAVAGVNDFSQGQISLYPNPSKGKVQILSRAIPFTKITLYNLQGQKAFEQEMNDVTEAELFLNDLKSGLYLMKITSINEDSVFKKLIIQ